MTEIYDYFRLLYARIGIPHCPVCGKEIKKQSVDQMLDQILALPEGTRIQLLAPVVRGRKGMHQKLVAVCGFLVNGNGWGKPLDFLHIWLLHLPQELPGIGRKGFHISALPFRINRVKGRMCGFHHEMRQDDKNSPKWKEGVTQNGESRKAVH